MKKIALSVALSLLSLGGWSQEKDNLVENPSFENTGDCPIISPVFLDFIEPWTHYFGAPEYYHRTCGDPGSPTTTNNTQAFDGSGFVKIAVYGDTGSAYVREYVHGELDEALEEGKYYRVTFYVKPLNNDAAGISYGINNIGLALTEEPIDSVNDDRVYDEITPQVKSTDVIITETYWTAICGIVKAKGGERHITIGNFNEDFETTATPLLGAANPGTAEYMIDFVEVVENDLPSLPEDTIICFEERIDLRVSAPDVSVEWSDESRNANFTITEPGIYFATISTPRCSYTDSILVEEAVCDECKIYVPNAFTPNNDRLNDVFKLQAECEDLQTFHLSIFDRWGQKVFESTNPDLTDNDALYWDGTHNDGERCAQGIYSYTLEYEYPLFRRTQTLTRRGTITLIR